MFGIGKKKQDDNMVIPPNLNPNQQPSIITTHIVHEKT